MRHARLILLGLLVGLVSASLVEQLVGRYGPEGVHSSLTEAERAALQYEWRAWARPEQMAPAGDWSTWLALAGRGWGKTRTGAEWVREREEGGARRIALVGRTAADVRDVMVEGESGLLSVYPPDERPIYEPSKRRVTWPKTGAIATTYSGDKPAQLRGPQHDTAWADEPAQWRYPESWDQLQLGLRLGSDPRNMATTTPLPVRLIRDLLVDPDTRVTRGTTYDNRGNLPRKFFERIIRRYEGTRVGDQELLGRLLDEYPGALWKRALLDKYRVARAPDLVRIAVGVDPSVADPDNQADEDLEEDGTASTGIVAAGVTESGHVYVMRDDTLRDTPEAWARQVVSTYKDLSANLVVAEINQGGGLVRATLRMVDVSLPYKGVSAKRGKYLRAEPVAALYEQGFVHHVGNFPDLEDQMCQFVPAMPRKMLKDRVDALVYAVTELVPFIAEKEAAADPPPLDPMDAMLERLEQRSHYADLDMDPGEES